MIILSDFILHPFAGLVSQSHAICSSTRSPFNGLSLHFSSPPPTKLTQMRRVDEKPRPILMMVKPAIQFIRGIDEQTVPDVKLTKSRDGTNSTATFTFLEPSVFDSSGDVNDITGFYMIDEEGVCFSQLM